MLKPVIFAAAATLSAASALAAAQTSPGANAIALEVRGLRNGEGVVDCYLYASADGFPGDLAKAQKRTIAQIVGRQATCRFEAVAAGAYAIAVVHDEHATGELGRNLVGIPTEGVGASNDAAGHFGPPSFAAARFDYLGGAKNLLVHVHYLL